MTNHPATRTTLKNEPQQAKHVTFQIKSFYSHVQNHFAHRDRDAYKIANYAVTEICIQHNNIKTKLNLIYFCILNSRGHTTAISDYIYTAQKRIPKLSKFLSSNTYTCILVP